MSWIEPKCLRGYKILTGAGRIERNDEGVRMNIPEPIVENCCQTEGLCWWLRPVGFSFSITIPVVNVKNFWRNPEQ